MPNNVSHFDIHCDDLARAQRFYGEVFGWRFDAWGPPDFFLITTGDETELGIHGALTKRHLPLVEGGRNGFECTISIDDIEAIRVAIEKAGGEIVMGPQQIPTVGMIVQFLDSERNLVCAMQYDADHMHPALR
jgi:predicted enzyme related to lactoylglutathione lyase